MIAENKTYTITSPIYYINYYPHLGTAYTTVLTDVLARYHRSRGRGVFFLTGTDENGEKVMRAGQDRGLTPRQFVDEMSLAYKTAWNGLDISYDRFIRTVDEDHVRAVTRLFTTLQERGDIYKGRYEGWYCVHDETFILDAPDGKCPECGRPVERAARDAYFFALSKYTDRLLELYERQPDFVQPESSRNEVVRFIRDGLRDMCISRTNNGWGIPVPGDPEHVVYVWFDALVNYIAACGYPDDPERFERLWPASLHVVGKDILVRFHATLWPATLIGAGLALPRQILAHGWLLVDGQKMSKSRIAQQISKWHEDGSASLTITGLRPDELVRSLQEVAEIPREKTSIAVDALRYFLVRDLPPGADAEFSPDRIVERYNADLANDVGNLLNRALSMLQRYRDTVVPRACAPSVAAAPLVNAAAAAYEALEPGEALAQVSKLIAAGNHLIDDRKPWNLQKEGRQAELDETLYSCGEICRIAAVLMAPVMPSVAREILRQLGIPDDPGELLWERTAWGRWETGSRALTPEPIFPRIEARKAGGAQSGKNAATKTERGQTEPNRPAASSKESDRGTETGAESGAEIAEISIEEFQRLHFRIATIREAEKVEGARKLIRLTLDLGDEQRQIVSGIADQYSPEELVGRQIAVIVNLKPATIRGVKSFGMLLAADAEGSAILLQPDRPVPPGSPVR